MERPLPITEADAVVIGAGAFGLSAAYQLAAHGAGRVVVLDRFAPGSQTSPRAAGLYKLIQADETLTRLAQASIEVIRGFSEATGVPLSFVQSGSILAARTTEHAALVDEEAEAAAGWGVEFEKIDEKEVRRVAPYLTGRGIRSAYFVPGDIYIEEPQSLLDAYMAAIAQLGSLVIGEAPVTGIMVDNGADFGSVHVPWRHRDATGDRCRRSLGARSRGARGRRGAGCTGATPAPHHSADRRHVAARADRSHRRCIRVPATGTRRAHDGRYGERPDRN